MNEFAILLVMNIIFVLLLNFDKSVVTDIHNFFKNHIYDAIPSLLSIPSIYYFDRIFGNMLMCEKLQNSMTKMFDKDSNRNYTKSMLYFLIQICLVFLLSSVLYVQIRESLKLILKTKNNDKSEIGFAIFFVNIIVFHILMVVIQQLLKENLLKNNNFIKYIITIVMILSIGFFYVWLTNWVYYDKINGTVHKKLIDKISSKVKGISGIAYETVYASGKLIVGLMCVYFLLFMLFTIYDKIRNNSYEKHVDNKRKVFQSICYILYGSVIAFVI
jgi:hypothetical protein